ATADRRDGAVDRRSGLADPNDELGRLDERVVPGLHRRRARVARVALDDELAARDADDSRDDAERRTGRGQARPLFDVQLEEGARPRAPTRHERAAADAADLLPAEDDGRARAGRRDRLERGDDSQ